MARAKHEQEIQQYLISREWKKLSTSCEEYEIEAASDNLAPPFYGVQLLSYLLANDLTNAKYLWKRLPTQIKNGEIAAVWKIGQAMWSKNYAEIYNSLNGFQWTEPHKTLVQILAEQFRNQTFVLLSKAYTTISAADAAAYLGLNAADTVKLTTQQGWTFDQSSNLLTPKPIAEQKQQSTSLVHLQQLTEYFTFLEN